MPNSDTLVFPSITAPALRTRSTTAAFRSGTRSSCTTDPMVVRTPAVICVSLMGTGRPCMAPSLSPRITASSAACACSSARSRVTRRKESICGSRRAIRSKNISASSTGETCFVAISSSSSVAGSYASRSSAITVPPCLCGRVAPVVPRAIALVRIFERPLVHEYDTLSLVLVLRLEKAEFGVGMKAFDASGPVEKEPLRLLPGIPIYC